MAAATTEFLCFNIYKFEVLAVMAAAMKWVLRNNCKVMDVMAAAATEYVNYKCCHGGSHEISTEN